MKTAVFTFLLAATTSAAASQVYTLDLTRDPEPIQRGLLDLGGTGPGGRSIAVNSHFIGAQTSISIAS